MILKFSSNSNKRNECCQSKLKNVEINLQIRFLSNIMHKSCSELGSQQLIYWWVRAFPLSCFFQLPGKLKKNIQQISANNIIKVLIIGRLYYWSPKFMYQGVVKHQALKPLDTKKIIDGYYPRIYITEDWSVNTYLMLLYFF